MKPNLNEAPFSDYQISQQQMVLNRAIQDYVAILGPYHTMVTILRHINLVPPLQGNEDLFILSRDILNLLSVYRDEFIELEEPDNTEELPLALVHGMEIEAEFTKDDLARFKFCSPGNKNKDYCLSISSCDKRKKTPGKNTISIKFKEDCDVEFEKESGEIVIIKLSEIYKTFAK